MRLREVKPSAQSHTAISDRARTGLRVVPPANDAIPTFRTDHSRINRGESNGPHKGVSMSGPETSRERKLMGVRAVGRVSSHPSLDAPSKGGP